MGEQTGIEEGLRLVPSIYMYTEQRNFEGLLLVLLHVPLLYYEIDFI